MGKQTITNVSGGPKIINGAEGAVLIADGESAEVEVSEAELKVAKSTEWFEFGAKAAKEAAKADDKD